MKKVLIILLAVGILAGCTTKYSKAPVIMATFREGEEKISNVGSEMISIQECDDVNIQEWEGLLMGGYTKRVLYRECTKKGELIYNGVSKNTLKVSFREYSMDMKKPNFFQDLIYDLDQDKVIQFRSIRIKVLDANNSTIKFIPIDWGKKKEIEEKFPNTKFEYVVELF